MYTHTVHAQPPPRAFFLWQMTITHKHTSTIAKASVQAPPRNTRPTWCENSLPLVTSDEQHIKNISSCSRLAAHARRYLRHALLKLAGLLPLWRDTLQEEPGDRFKQVPAAPGHTASFRASCSCSAKTRSAKLAHWVWYWGSTRVVLGRC